MNNKELNLMEKSDIINKEKIDKEVLEYLKDRFQNLYIEVCGEYEGNLLDLMEHDALLGWCFETTETAIVFLNDNDYIERGKLRLDKYTPSYYHSWICFKFNNEEYVFDPCLNYICKKNTYHELFNAKVMAKISSKRIKEEIIYQIKNKKEKSGGKFTDFLKHFCSEETIERINNEVKIKSRENVHEPIYRNGSGYRATIEDGKIKKLTAHYYEING